MLALQSLREQKKWLRNAHRCSHALKAKRIATKRNAMQWNETKQNDPKHGQQLSSMLFSMYVCTSVMICYRVIDKIQSNGSGYESAAAAAAIHSAGWQFPFNFTWICRKLQCFFVVLLSVTLFSSLSLFFVVCQNWEVLHQKHNSIHAINIQAPKESKESMWNDLRKTRSNAAIYSQPACISIGHRFWWNLWKMSAKNSHSHAHVHNLSQSSLFA